MTDLAQHIACILNQLSLSSPLWMALRNLEFDDEYGDMETDWRYVDYEIINDRIHEELFSYVRLAYFLEKMRYYKKYKKQGFKSFQEYCLKVLRKSAHYCKKIISAAHVCVELAVAGFDKLPTCVAQALPLIKFHTYDGGGNCPLAEKWQKVLDETPDDKPITSVTIAQIVDERPPEAKPLPIKVKPETYAKLEKIAQAKGVTIQEVIDDLADLLLDEIEAEPTPVTPEEQEEWEADVENLVAEKVRVDWEISDSNGTSHHTSYIHPRPGTKPDSG